MKYQSTFGMARTLKLMVPFLAFFQAFSMCRAQNGYTVNAIVEQEVVMPCGVQVQGPWTRLVWKLGSANNSEDLAYSYQGSLSCNAAERDCSLTQDGSLVIRNVKKTDGGDYFCALDDEKYYSQHTLIISPKAAPLAFEVCPNSEDVFVAQTGPQEIVLAYTSPVCRNSDVVGNVTCDPSSGAKIGMDFTEIVCACSHSGNIVDTCQIPIPDVPPSFENCPASRFVSVSKSDGSSLISVSYANPICRNSKDMIGVVSCDPPSGTMTDVEKVVCKCIVLGNTVDTCEIPVPIPPVSMVCTPVSALGIFLGIIIGAVLCGLGMAIYISLHRKCSSKKPVDKKDSPEVERLMEEAGKTKENTSLPQRPGEKSQEFGVMYTNDKDHGREPLKTRESEESVNSDVVAAQSGTPPNPEETKEESVNKQDPSLRTPANPEETKEESVNNQVAIAESGTPNAARRKEEPVNSQDSTPGFGSSQVQSQDVGIMLGSGQLLASVTDAEKDGVDCTDGDIQETKDSQPSFAEMKQFFVKGETPKFRILPSMEKPLNGIEIKCQFRENLILCLHEESEVFIPDITYERLISGLSTSVAEVVTLPVHITCHKCERSCCILEICGDKWIEMDAKALCKGKVCEDAWSE